MKTKNLGKKHIEHLLSIGYILGDNIEDLINFPYVLIKEDTLYICDSVKEFNDFDGQLKTKEQILKVRPVGEKVKIKKSR